MTRKNWPLKHVFLLIFFATILNGGYSQSRVIIQFKQAKSLTIGLYGMSYATDQKRIYVFGGGTKFNQYTNTIRIYDCVLNEWLDLSVVHDLKPTRYGRGVYLPEFNSIAFLGGVTPINTAIMMVDKITNYNLDNFSISSLGTSPLQSKLMGTDYWAGNIYMFGGSVSAEMSFNGFTVLKFSNELYSYSPENGVVELLPNHPEAKEMNGGIIDGKLYTFGGYDNTANKNIHVYDINTKNWSFVGAFDKPLSAYALVKYGQYFLLIGDYSDAKQMIIFDTKNNTWESYEINFGGRYMGAVVIKNTLHVFGGLEWKEALREHWVLDLDEFFN